MTRDGQLDASGQATKRPPSGIQYTITDGESRAVVTQVGATLRELAFGGVPVIDGFDVEQRASDGRGQVLAPWPNRLTSGRYVFGGQACQAPINEPSTTSAIHGLVRWLDWTLVELEDSAVTLACVVREQPGYEWQLDLEVAYRLGDEGLTVTTRVFNSGTRDAPFGIGFHPYLTVGRAIDSVRAPAPGPDDDRSGRPRCTAEDRASARHPAGLLEVTLDRDEPAGHLLRGARAGLGWPGRRHAFRPHHRSSRLAVGRRGVPLLDGLHRGQSWRPQETTAVHRHRAHVLPTERFSKWDRHGPAGASRIVGSPLGYFFLRIARSDSCADGHPVQRHATHSSRHSPTSRDATCTLRRLSAG